MPKQHSSPELPAASAGPPLSLWPAPDLTRPHGRFSNFGLPVNWIAADILRIENGILMEHWDVPQDEATEAQSKSKAPMFGSTFPTYS